MDELPKVVHCKVEAAEVYIGRPGPYGNPFKLNNPQDEAERRVVLKKYQAWIQGNPDFRRFVKRNLEHKSLGCWCAPRACHGDVLVRVANDPEQASKPPVFVFGSNLAGRHGKGAAEFARKYRGAEYGRGQGPTGNAYAIPTKDRNLRVLPLEEINQAVQEFLDYARDRPEQDFDVTAIGCGLAGYPYQTIAPLFQEAPDNCRLPGQWTRLNGQATGKEINRVVILGKSGQGQETEAFERIAKILGQLRAPRIISMAEHAGEAYAVQFGLPFERIPLEVEQYGSDAVAAFNQHLIFLGTHVITVGPAGNLALRRVTELARASGLATREIHLQPIRDPAPRVTGEKETGGQKRGQTPNPK